MNVIKNIYLILFLMAANALQAQNLEISEASCDAIISIHQSKHDYNKVVLLEKKVTEKIWQKITSIETNENNHLFDGLSDGTYRVTLMSHDRGNLISEHVSLECKREAISSASIRVFPNPTTDFINVHIPMKEVAEYNYRLAQVDGRILLSGEMETMTSVIDLSQMTTGIYYLSIYENGALMEATKVLIN